MKLTDEDGVIDDCKARRQHDVTGPKLRTKWSCYPLQKTTERTRGRRTRRVLSPSPLVGPVRVHVCVYVSVEEDDSPASIHPILLLAAGEYDSVSQISYQKDAPHANPARRTKRKIACGASRSAFEKLCRDTEITCYGTFTIYYL